MNVVCACLLAYLIGSIPPLRPPKMPFHTSDAAFHTLPIKNVLAIYFLDLGKGALAVITAWLMAGVVAAHFAVIFVVLGEVYPCFPSYHSRNGWAVAAGALLVISPILILISLCVYLLSLLLTRTFGLSFAIALLAFLIGLVLFAAQIYLWVLVIGLVGMLSIKRLKHYFQHVTIRRWKR